MRRHGPYYVAELFLLLLLIVLQNYYSSQSTNLPPHDHQTDFLFCHWNIENLFDDEDNGRKGPGDRDYDPLYAHNPDLLKLKLDKLTEAILRMNNGKGPDILALVEVEGVRAAE